MDYFAAIPREIVSKDDKVLWKADASSTFDSRYEPSLAIDGTNTNFWHNVAGGAFHSWLQVKTDQEHWVKGVKSSTRAINSFSKKFIEVSYSSKSFFFNFFFAVFI